MPHFGE